MDTLTCRRSARLHKNNLNFNDPKYELWPYRTFMKLRMNGGNNFPLTESYTKKLDQNC